MLAHSSGLEYERIPPNIIGACICWAFAAGLLIHAFFAGLPQLSKKIKIPIIALSLAGITWMLWNPVVEEYRKEYPSLSARNTTIQPQDAKPPEPPKQEEKKTAPAKKEKTKPNVQQQSQGNDSPNTNITGNQNVVGNNNTINYSDPEIKARLDEIENILQEQQGAKISPDALLKKYPLGYVIFDVDSQKSVLPYQNKALKDWNFDWSVVELTSYYDLVFHQSVDNSYWLRLPDIRSKQGPGHMLNCKIGIAKQVGPINPAVIWRYGNVDLRGEVLAVTRNGVIFILGFVDNTKTQAAS